jgi:murein L,D-transpeptidase YafK
VLPNQNTGEAHITVVVILTVKSMQVIYGEGAQEDAKLDFRLDEFVPSGNAQYRRNLRLDWKQWWNQLEHAREGLVISRARKAVEKFAKRKQPKSRKKSSSGGSKGSNK